MCSKLFWIMSFIMLISTAVLAQEWQDSPNHWSKMPAEIREALKPGLPKYSNQIQDGPFGSHIWVMGANHDIDNITFLLDQLAATGMKWVRDGVDNFVELRPAETLEQAYKRWKTIPEHYFTYCKEAQARGIRILVVLKVLGVPKDKASEAWVQLVKNIVPALKPWVKDWEMGNEPNPEMPPAEYVASIAQAYRVIKEIDPEARVHAPALSKLESLLPAVKGSIEPYPDPRSCYVDGLLEAGLLNVCDVFSYHPYRGAEYTSTFPERASEYDPYTKWPNYPAQIKDLRAKLKKAAGRDFPVSNTEFGNCVHFDKATGQRVKSFQTQSKYALRASIMDHYLGVYPSFNFLFRSAPMRGAYVAVSNMATIDADWRRNPKYYAYTGLCSILDSRDKPIDIAMKVLSSDREVTESLYLHPFHRQPQTLGVDMFEEDLPLRFRMHREQTVEMITVAFWRGIEGTDKSTEVPIDIELTLPDAGYGYPILLDPIKMFIKPFTPLDYRQNGNKYVIANLPASDSPAMLRFFKVKVKPMRANNVDIVPLLAEFDSNSKQWYWPFELTAEPAVYDLDAGEISISLAQMPGISFDQTKKIVDMKSETMVVRFPFSFTSLKNPPSPTAAVRLKALGKTTDHKMVMDIPIARKVAGDVDWNKTFSFYVNRGQKIAPDMLSQWKGPKDFSAVVQTAYDNKNLYIRADVTDNAVIENQMTERYWESECVELFFSIENRQLSDSPQVPLTQSDFQVIIPVVFAPKPGQRLWVDIRHPDDGIDNMDVKFKRTEKGYEFLAVIGFKELGLKNPQSGKSIGFDIAFDDADTAKTKFQIRWQSNKDIFQNVANYGTLWLMDTK